MCLSRVFFPPASFSLTILLFFIHYNEDFFYHPPCSQTCFSASSQKHVGTQDIKFSFCSSCAEVRAGIHCLAEGPLSREVCLYRGAWTWVLQWKTLSTLPTQSHTTNWGNSRLNKENERRINNHRWAEHGAAYYLDLEMEEKKQKTDRRAIRKQGGAGEQEDKLRNTRSLTHTHTHSYFLFSAQFYPRYISF